MCVMSLSVMAYHSDRSLATSVKMMEVGVWVGLGPKEVNQDRKEEEKGEGLL